MHLLAEVEKKLVVATLVAIVAGVLWGTFARYLPIKVGIGLVAAEEVSRLLLIYFTFLGAAYVYRKRGHLRLGLVFDHAGSSGKFILGIVRNIVEISTLSALIIASLFYCWEMIGVRTVNMQWPAVILVFPLIAGSIAMFISSITRLVLRK